MFLKNTRFPAVEVVYDAEKPNSMQRNEIMLFISRAKQNVKYSILVQKCLLDAFENNRDVFRSTFLNLFSIFLSYFLFIFFWNSATCVRWSRHSPAAPAATIELNMECSVVVERKSTSTNTYSKQRSVYKQKCGCEIKPKDSRSVVYNGFRCCAGIFVFKRC